MLSPRTSPKPFVILRGQIPVNKDLRSVYCIFIWMRLFSLTFGSHTILPVPLKQRWLRVGNKTCTEVMSHNFPCHAIPVCYLSADMDLPLMLSLLAINVPRRLHAFNLAACHFYADINALHCDSKMNYYHIYLCQDIRVNGVQHLHPVFDSSSFQFGGTLKVIKILKV